MLVGFIRNVCIVIPSCILVTRHEQIPHLNFLSVSLSNKSLIVSVLFVTVFMCSRSNLTIPFYTRNLCFRFWFSWTFLVLYCKVKVESNGDKGNFFDVKNRFLSNIVTFYTEKRLHTYSDKESAVISIACTLGNIWIQEVITFGYIFFIYVPLILFLRNWCPVLMLLSSKDGRGLWYCNCQRRSRKNRRILAPSFLQAVPT